MLGMQCSRKPPAEHCFPKIHDLETRGPHDLVQCTAKFSPQSERHQSGRQGFRERLVEVLPKRELNETLRKPTTTTTTAAIASTPRYYASVELRPERQRFQLRRPLEAFQRSVEVAAELQLSQPGRQVATVAEILCRALPYDTGYLNRRQLPSLLQRQRGETRLRRAVWLVIVTATATDSDIRDYFGGSSSFLASADAFGFNTTGVTSPYGFWGLTADAHTGGGVSAASLADREGNQLKLHRISPGG